MSCLRERKLRAEVGMAHRDLNDRARKLARYGTGRPSLADEAKQAKARVAECEAALVAHRGECGDCE